MAIEQGKGELKGTDAPGFGDENTRRAAPPQAAAQSADAETVAEEFDGMDNDLIDMGSFGAPGTGRGTQTGGAGERLRPTPSSTAEGDDEGEDLDETSAGGLQYPDDVPTSHPEKKS